MDKKVEQFKADYAMLEAQVKQIKQKLRALKKEVTPIINTANRLYKRGCKTMYIEEEGHAIKPKFNSLPKILDNLLDWTTVDIDIQDLIDTAFFMI